mgnify:CR=1 FL=1
MFTIILLAVPTFAFAQCDPSDPYDPDCNPDNDENSSTAVPTAPNADTSPTTPPSGTVTGAPATTVSGTVTNSPPTTVSGTTNRGSGTFYLQNPLDPKFNSVGGLVQGFLEIFSYLVVLLAVLMLIWVGLQFVLAQGKPERMKELKNWLLWIVIGVAIVIGARIIVTVVINTLEATGTVSPRVIENANNAIRGN